jgi:hypothetical protein
LATCWQQRHLPRPLTQPQTLLDAA